MVEKYCLKCGRVFNNQIQNLKSDSGYCYHATNEERAEEIIDFGKLRTFRPNEFTDQNEWPDGSTEKRSYWSLDASLVWQFAPEEGKPVILRTKITPEFKQEKYTKDIYTTAIIPITRIEFLSSEGWTTYPNMPKKLKTLSLKPR